MTFSLVLHEASQPGRELNLASTVLTESCCFKMAQTVECINEGFFQHFKSFTSGLHSLVYLLIISRENGQFTGWQVCSEANFLAGPVNVITWKIFIPVSWDPGITISGSRLTGLAWLSCNRKVDFCCVKQACRDLGKPGQLG